MTTKKASPKTFSLTRFILKLLISCLAITLILIIVLLFTLPSLLSSDLARENITAYLSKDLKRPVSINKFSFSWGKGISLSGFNIKEKDQTPFLDLNELKLIVSWLSLLGGKIDIDDLTIIGIDVTLTRDKSGKTNISDILETSPKEAPSKEKDEFTPQKLPALFLDAHIRKGNFTFVDRRLNSITRVKDLNVDLSIPSLNEQINFLLNTNVILDDKPPESIELTGTAHLASKGKFDPRKARGNLEMKAGFGHIKAFLDLAKFDSPDEVTGASLSCLLDLNKLAKLGAGILGFPPGFSLEGQLKSTLDVRGNMESHIALNGDTVLKNLSIKGGPFKDASFKQPQIILSQDMLIAFATNSIDIKSLALKSDFINLSILGTIDDFQKHPNGTIHLSGMGNLNEIILVLRKVLPIPPDLKISGDMNLTLSGTGDLNKLNVKGTTGIKDLKINADFLGNHPFKEKSLKITPDITINASKHTYDLASLNIRSEILDADIKGVLDDEINIDLKGNLSTKFSNLKGQLKGVLPSVFPDQGQLTSDLTIKGSLKNSIAIKGNHRIKDAKIIFPSSSTKPVTPPETISFSKLTVTHDAAYNANQDKLTLMSLKADSSFLNLEASGSLSQISKNLSLQCQGNADLEMQEVQKSLKDFLPEGLTARGKGNITFSCGGNLSSPDDKPMFSTWDGNGSLSVDSINYQTIGSIKDLQTKNLSLKKGVLDTRLMCQLNNGPTQAEGKFDFGKKTPAMKVNLEAKDIQLSQDLKILGYIIPILIIPPSGQLSGKANLSAQASWQGTSWDSEIGKTINGEGELILNDGTIRSQNVLSQVLKSFGKPETLKFKQISTSFRLKDEKIYNDNVQVNGDDLNFNIKGWTSLVYIASQNGNPMEYSVTGDFLEESLGRDAKKVLSIIGGGEPVIPVVIAGTVQKPKIAIKMPKAGDLIQEIFGSDKKKR
jgi:hypothetical protein